MQSPRTDAVLHALSLTGVKQTGNHARGTPNARPSDKAMVILFSSKRTLTALISEALIPCSFNSLSVRFCHFHSFAQHLSVEPVVICQPNWIEPKFCINAILNDMNMDRLTWISFV